MIQTYEQAIDYLYKQLLVYQQVGSIAYKANLDNTLKLCAYLGNPQHAFKSIHVAGTNGKGSASHMIGAVLQSAGYRTGLYTSPHLKEFTERIKINGEEIKNQFVVDFVNKMLEPIKEIKPSFFELTVAMAFAYFAEQKVDAAVIEVGLGGRLDSTNVINPEVSLITNIGYDHMDILGNTLVEIAKEKAGIIKQYKSVVISERQPEVENVFIEQARAKQAPISFATDFIKIIQQPDGKLLINQDDGAWTVNPELKGNYQKKNIAGVIRTCQVLREKSYVINDESIIHGIEKVISLTGLKGRWQIIRKSPLVICDTGHNVDGIKEVISQIKTTPHDKLKWVFGVVRDKDPNKVLSILPKDCQYYFCQAKIQRAMDASDLMKIANEYNLTSKVVADVNDAIAMAIGESSPNDLIMVGGSTFVVAEVNGI